MKGSAVATTILANTDRFSGAMKGISNSVKDRWMYILEKAYSQKNDDAAQVQQHVVDDHREDGIKSENRRDINDRLHERDVYLFGTSEPEKIDTKSSLPNADKVFKSSGVTNNLPIFERRINGTNTLFNQYSDSLRLATEKPIEKPGVLLTESFKLSSVEKDMLENIQIHILEDGVHVIVFDKTFKSDDHSDVLKMISMFLQDRNKKLVKLTINGNVIWRDSGPNKLPKNSNSSNLTDCFINKVY